MWSPERRSRPGKGGSDLCLAARDLVSFYNKRESGSSMTAVRDREHLSDEVRLWA